MLDLARVTSPQLNIICLNCFSANLGVIKKNCTVEFKPKLNSFRHSIALGKVQGNKNKEEIWIINYSLLVLRCNMHQSGGVS